MPVSLEMNTLFILRPFLVVFLKMTKINNWVVSAEIEVLTEKFAELRHNLYH